jgi:hypothetical protein
LVATFDRHDHGHGDGDDDGDGDGDGDGSDDGDDQDSGEHSGDVGDANDDTRPAEPETSPTPQTNGLSAQVSPNPFNPSTVLTFTIAREGRVRVTIFDIQGRLVTTLLDGTRAAGEQRVIWDGSNSHNQTVSSGVYFVRIQAPEGEATRKLTVMK